MRKLLSVFILFCLTAIGAKAQDVFNEIYRLSEKAANDRSNTVEDRKINTFKMDALSYMKTKTLERLLENNREIGSVISDSTINKLNHQAYALYSYINLYIRRMARCEKDSQLDKVKQTFREATLNNPMYGDKDKELVLSYVNNTDFLTRFSLDTDWEKALDEVISQ